MKHLISTKKTHTETVKQNRGRWDVAADYFLQSQSMSGA